jgi:hypothetical protein
MPKGNPNPENKWKRGHSGNPSGRPKNTFRYVDELSYQLNQVKASDEEKRSHWRIIIDKQIALAELGSVRVVGEILDRLYGKPVQSVLTADMTPEDTDAALAKMEEIIQRNRERIAKERVKNADECNQSIQ